MNRLLLLSLFLLGFFIFAVILVAGKGSEDAEIKNPYLSDIIPCELLTPEQVETVLPGSDDGYEAAAGGSLMKGVDSYQCSYSNDKFDLFTVIIHIAVDEENFNWVKPKPKVLREFHKDVRELKIGDGAWLFGKSDDIKVEIIKGYTVIELHLMAVNAAEKSDALVELASALVNKIK